MFGDLEAEKRTHDEETLESGDEQQMDELDKSTIEKQNGRIC